MKSILLNLNISFKKEYKIGNYPVDFFLPEYNLSIQCDGCWHHNKDCDCLKKVDKIYPRQIFQERRDRACIAYHKYHKINIVRFKGCEILNKANEIKNRINIIIKKIESGETVHEYKKQ